MAGRLLQGERLSDFTPSDTTFLETIIGALEEHSETTLLVDSKDGRSITFGEVHAKASAVKEFLVGLGIKNEDIVLIVSNNTVEAYVFTMGVWLSGATSAPINATLPKDEIQRFIEIGQSRVVYAGEEFARKVLEVCDGLDWDVTVIAPNGVEPVFDLNQVMEEPAELVTHVHQPLGKDHCVMVLFTSGTTGQPKGVRCRDEAFQFNSTPKGLTTTDWRRPLISSPIYWVSNPICWSISVKQGATVILTDRASPRRLLEVITQYKPREWFTGPSVLNDMCQLEGLESYDLSSLEEVMVGGAALYPDQRRLITERIFRGRNLVRVAYGSTEGGMVTADPKAPDPGSPCYTSIGKPYPNVIIKLIDPETEELVPPHAMGEICVKSPAVIRSYLNKEISPSELDNDGFWHMGDVGYYDEQDFIYYVSRIKDVMKYRGQQIAPAELEEVIQKHPDVVESAVVGRPSPECGELPTAFVVIKPDATVSPEELDNFVAERVIDEKKLRGGVYIVDSLPRSLVGKILRRELIATFNT